MENKIKELEEKLLRKEQECRFNKLKIIALQEALEQYETENDKLKQTLTEIKEIVEKSCCLQPTSTCEEYENCKECSRISDDETVQQILQKISEVEDG